MLPRVSFAAALAVAAMHGLQRAIGTMATARLPYGGYAALEWGFHYLIRLASFFMRYCIPIAAAPTPSDPAISVDKFQDVGFIA